MSARPPALSASVAQMTDEALILDLIAALELCLECEGLTWEAEHDATIMVARAKRRLDPAAA
jgi:hypothetical protein